MSENDDGTEWNFEVKGVKTKDENDERLRRKERLAQQLSQKEEKRDAAKDLLEAQKPKKMKVEEAKKTKKSRTQLAKEMEKELGPSFAEQMASPIKRGIAFFIDLAVMGGFLAFLISKWTLIEFKILQYLREENINQSLHPDTFKLYVLGALFLAFYLIVMVLPVCSFKKSFGKVLTKISIHSSDEEWGIGSIAIFFRELIIKPISVVSVIGGLAIFTNKNKRSLHDFLTGSVVIDDSLIPVKKRA